jgi:hypothetical protein
MLFMCVINELHDIPFLRGLLTAISADGTTAAFTCCPAMTPRLSSLASPFSRTTRSHLSAVVIARSEATKQSSAKHPLVGIILSLRTRNDGGANPHLELFFKNYLIFLKIYAIMLYRETIKSVFNIHFDTTAWWSLTASYLDFSVTPFLQDGPPVCGRRCMNDSGMI